MDRKGTPMYRQQPWPADNQWVAYFDVNWVPFRAISLNENPDATDITSGGRRNQVGPYNSVFIFFDPATETMFFRMLLSANPATFNPFVQYVWGVFFDTDGDGWAEWGTMVDGKAQPFDQLKVNDNDAGDTDNAVDVTVFAVSADPAQGYTRVMSGPTGEDGRQLWYLDWQVPLSAFASDDPAAPPPINPETQLRMVYGTSTSDQVLNKDLITGGSVDFNQVAPIQPGDIPEGKFGRLFDTRDPEPPSDAGIWKANETVQVSGSGWPHNINELWVRILDPDGLEVFQGTVPVSNGIVSAANTWNIPPEAKGGVYSIQADSDPITPAPEGWLSYDTFKVVKERPTVAVVQPNGEEVWFGSQTIQWNAADPDGEPLTFTVQYSPDGGTTFFTVVSGLTASEYLWDTTTVADGIDYIIKVIASDGEQTVSDVSDRPLTIDNTPPTVSITAPPDNSTVEGVVSLQGSAADNIQLVAVDLYIDGMLLNTFSETPASWSYQWDTTLWANGQHIVTAVARDLAGNTTGTTNTYIVENTGSVSGTVTNEQTGDPVAGATVTLLNEFNVVVATATTDAAGAFSFVDVPIGSYSLIGEKDGFGQAITGVIVETDQTSTANLALPPNPGTVSGVVLATATGNPIANATVQVITPENVIVGSAVTAGDGSYAITNLNPGSYHIVAMADGFAAENKAATALSDTVTTVDFTLEANSGAIEGTVLNDDTADPISGAAVSLFSSGSILIDSAVTNAQGEFSFPSVAPGTYTVLGSAAGFQNEALGVAIEPGQTETVVLRLALNPLPAVIEGVVTNAATGQSIEGAMLTLFDATGIQLAVISSGANGEYRFGNLEAGNYIIVASADNFGSASLGTSVLQGQVVQENIALAPGHGTIQGKVTSERTGQPLAGAIVKITDSDLVLVATAITDQNGDYNIADLQPGNYTAEAGAEGFAIERQGVTITTGDIATANFSLQDNPGSITGTVRNKETGAPITGALVKVLDENLALITSVLTDSTGQYFINGLQPGSYTLVATKEDFGDGHIGIIVESGQISTGDLTLTANPAIVGGTVINARTGELISGALVQLMDENAVVVNTTLTDNGGNYNFSGVVVGTYTIKASADGFATAIVGAIVEPGDILQVPINLEPNPGSISGTVTATDTGAALAGASVRVYSGGGLLLASVSTNDAGEYLVSSLSPGSYSVTVVKDGYGINTLGAVVEQNQTTVLDFALTSRTGSISIAGRVTAAATGEGLGSATVELINSLGLTIDSTLTDPEGNYLFKDLESGAYTVVAAKPGFARAIKTVSVTTGTIANANLALGSVAGAVTGVIYSSVTGLPLPGALILIDSEGVVIAEAVSGVNGEYFVGSLPPGSYNMIVSADGYETMIAPLDIAGSETVLKNFTLSSNPGSVTGKVINQATKQPIPGVGILFIRDGTIVKRSVTGDEGNYLVEGLNGGVYTVRLVQKGNLLLEEILVVPEGELVHKDFLVLPGRVKKIKDVRTKVKLTRLRSLDNKVVIKGRIIFSIMVVYPSGAVDSMETQATFFGFVDLPGLACRHVDDRARVEYVDWKVKGRKVRLQAIVRVDVSREELRGTTQVKIDKELEPSANL